MQQIRSNLYRAAWFIAILWIVYAIDWILPVPLTQYGVIPRHLSGLVGIPCSPFLHANLSHLLSNTVPLAILLVLLCGSTKHPWETVATIILFGGSLLWLLGRSAVHVGASGLIYGLIAFIIVNGFREKKVIPIVVSLVVALLYGGTLLWGVLPSSDETVSWDGHLYGAIAGGLLGWFHHNLPKSDTTAASPTLS
ncbi:MAG: rhomboid family intramembrane serine protease [Pirellula sp.]|jgi:membrane associated rhomboid family serine protease